MKKTKLTKIIACMMIFFTVLACNPTPAHAIGGNMLPSMLEPWFTKSNIPARLKDSNGYVRLGDFDRKVPGKKAYRESGGWTIEKDTAGHGGSYWKLKNKSGDRVASLDQNGKVLRE